MADQKFLLGDVVEFTTRQGQLVAALVAKVLDEQTANLYYFPPDGGILQFAESAQYSEVPRSMSFHTFDIDMTPKTDAEKKSFALKAVESNDGSGEDVGGVDPSKGIATAMDVPNPPAGTTVGVNAGTDPTKVMLPTDGKEADKKKK